MCVSKRDGEKKGKQSKRRRDGARGRKTDQEMERTRVPFVRLLLISLPLTPFVYLPHHLVEVLFAHLSPIGLSQSINLFPLSSFSVSSLSLSYILFLSDSVSPFHPLSLSFSFFCRCLSLLTNAMVLFHVNDAPEHINMTVLALGQHVHHKSVPLR